MSTDTQSTPPAEAIPTVTELFALGLENLARFYRQNPTFPLPKEVNREVWPTFSVYAYTCGGWDAGRSHLDGDQAVIRNKKTTQATRDFGGGVRLAVWKLNDGPVENCCQSGGGSQLR